MRTLETYHAVMQSPLMTPELQQIYYVLFSGSPETALTRAEIEAACKAQNWVDNDKAPWRKALPYLVKMGLMKRGNKRHCTQTNKPEVTWYLTDSAVPIKPKPAKPSGKQFIRAVAAFEALIVRHEQAGDMTVTPELRKLYEWIRSKVPEKAA
jgi:hypothetical protein